MPSSRIPSPARSQGAKTTPRKYTPRRSRSVCSAKSNISTRLTSIISDSFKLSPMPNRRSVLPDDTDIEEPRRQSWWKNIGENSRDMMEVLENRVDDNEVRNVAEEFDVEILSQEKKNYTLDLPESSDGESISSIVIPQRKLFTQKENPTKKKFEQIMNNRETLTKLQKSHFDQDKEINTGRKTLFNQVPKPRIKPAFPPALLDISSKAANKTKEIPKEVQGQVRNLFGNRGGTKRKNMFADFIVSESEDEVPEIQAKIFEFNKNGQNRQDGIRETAHSPPSSIDLELDDWKLLPSSTMVENQLEEAATPVKRARMSKITDVRVSETINNSVNKTKQSNKSKNNSKITSSSKLKDEGNENSSDSPQIHENIENNQSLNSSNSFRLPTRNKSKSIRENSFKEANNSKAISKSKKNLQPNTNKEKSLVLDNDKNNEEKINDKVQRDEELHNTSEKVQSDDDGEDFTLEYENDDEQANQDVEKAIDVTLKENDNEMNQSKSSVKNKSLKVHSVENKSRENNDYDIMIAENYHNEHPSINNGVPDIVHTIRKTIESEKQSECYIREGINQSNLVEKPTEKNLPNIIVSEKVEENVEKGNQLNNEPIESEVEEQNVEEDEEQNIEEDEEQNIEEDDEQNIEEDEEQNIEEDEQNIEEGEEKNIEEDEEQNESEDEEENLEDDEEHNETCNEVSVEEDNDIDEQDGNGDVNQGDTEDNQDECEHTSEEQSDSEVEEEQSEEMETGDNESEEIEENETEQPEDEDLDEQNGIQISQNTNEQEPMESDNEQGDDNFENNEIPENDHESTQDTTGRHRNKDEINKSPEAILRDKTNKMEFETFTAERPNTSEPVRESVGLSINIDSSAEGSGWDSHRTTRKTLRQTFGKDYTSRKSLRALVMEKSAKQCNNFNDIADTNVDLTKIPHANSTELPDFDSYQEEGLQVNETAESEPMSDHEVSARTKQTTLETYLQKIKQENLEKKRKLEEQIRNSLKAPTSTYNTFKIPLRPVKRMKPTQSNTKTKQIKSIVSLDMLPKEVLDDMKYKPPKRFQPRNASWITKRLYKFLETKLEPKYDYMARVRAERLVESLYAFSREAKRDRYEHAVDELKKEMARLNIVKTHFDFYQFFHNYMPREIRIKVVPDIVNKISLPKHGVFSDIKQ